MKDIEHSNNPQSKPDILLVTSKMFFQKEKSNSETYTNCGPDSCGPDDSGDSSFCGPDTPDDLMVVKNLTLHETD
jgi:hypothetical protein